MASSAEKGFLSSMYISSFSRSDLKNVSCLLPHMDHFIFVTPNQSKRTVSRQIRLKNKTRTRNPFRLPSHANARKPNEFVTRPHRCRFRQPQSVPCLLLQSEPVQACQTVSLCSAASSALSLLL